jgi:hydrogenase/urease accessory protein HupE
MKRALLVLVWLTAFTRCGFAHEVRPAYLELRQTGSETYDALWKVPGQGENLRFGLYVEFPASCTNVTPPRGVMVNSAYLERWSVKCAGGLTGSATHIAGLSATLTDVLVRLQRLDGAAQVTRLTPSSPSFVAEAAPTAMGVARAYLALGVEHILTGIDHLLFVLGLVLLVRDRWTLVKTITAFTVAHSVTLGLATLGYVRVPAPPLNAAIALSILFVGVEVVRSWRGETSLALRYPWLVAFLFGLLHGIGFASGLVSLGLPQGEIPAALLSFNCGVEIGQLMFVAGILLLERAFRVMDIRWPRPLQYAPAYVLGTSAAYWTIDRIFAMLGGTT